MSAHLTFNKVLRALEAWPPVSNTLTVSAVYVVLDVTTGAFA